MSIAKTLGFLSLGLFCGISVKAQDSNKLEIAPGVNIGGTLKFAPSVLESIGLSKATPPAAQAVGSKWQPTKVLPTVVLIKYQEKMPDVVSVLLPTLVYKATSHTYQVVTKQALVSNSKETKIDTRIDKSAQDLIETYGALERKDISLDDVAFVSLDGVGIPKEEALARLKQPTHVFYEEGPDAYLRSIVKVETMVLVSSVPGKRLPRVPKKFPGQE